MQLVNCLMMRAANKRVLVVKFLSKVLDEAGVPLTLFLHMCMRY